MRYKAIFLDDNEFERLPYRDMWEKIGVADPKQGVAYARKSGLPILDAFNMMHELEHLEDGHEGVHADHYDKQHDVYYKSFSNLFGSTIRKPKFAKATSALGGFRGQSSRVSSVMPSIMKTSSGFSSHAKPMVSTFMSSMNKFRDRFGSGGGSYAPNQTGVPQ